MADPGFLDRGVAPVWIGGASLEVKWQSRLWAEIKKNRLSLSTIGGGGAPPVPPPPPIRHCGKSG